MDQILSLSNKINNITSNKYLLKLSQNPSLDNFLTSQDSFIDAVDNWSKILALLLTKLPSDKERSIIVNNLYDEHGSGNPNKSHVGTFKEFMKSLNYKEEVSLNSTNTFTHTIIKQFNDRLTHYIGMNNWIQNVAMLGMIEYVYITISTYIHNYVEQYIPSDQITHYSLHEIMDVKHSTELFELLVPYIDSNYNDIQNGLELGYFIFDDLYNSLSHYL
ncbi:heme oxygenase [Klosneuvirus KNV1]|uniref:Heme oxygenase n=1 Tax=Klosneuvirus KNV1 TaxID=1977640 RepID=A0A1V0SKU6_9VIRU|nr:heme oxygenase [Klosneuvirus KNV1]